MEELLSLKNENSYKIYRKFKLMNWRDIKSKVIGCLVSGGLDSCTVTHWLTSKGFSVNCFTVDLGQPDEDNLDLVADRMVNCGANGAWIIPGKKQLSEAGLKVIQAQACYEGGYWNTTSIARPVTVSVALSEMKSKNIEVFSHGATGRGNDQVRFQLATNILAPEVDMYAPWRDPEFVEQFPGRQQMIDYCTDNSLPIKNSGESKYSTDANFLGLTHEAGDLEQVNKAPFFVNPGMGVWPWDASDEYETVTVRWEEGVPVQINGENLDLVDIFYRANSIAGMHGVGIGTHVIENRFVGIKSRGIYESPGMELLGRAYEYLLQFILDRRARDFYTQISSFIGIQIYQGYWLDVGVTSALSALNPIISLATGTITLRLYKGSIYFEKADDTYKVMPHSLYTDDSSMEAIGAFNHTDAEGFLKVIEVSAKNFGLKQFPKLGR